MLGLRAQTRPRCEVVDPAAWFRHTELCPGVPGLCGGRRARGVARRSPDRRRGRGDRLAEERTRLSSLPRFPAASAWGGGRGCEPEMEVAVKDTPGSMLDPGHPCQCRGRT